MSTKKSLSSGSAAKRTGARQNALVLRLCLLGFAAALNAAGSNLALLLRLPLYLDTMGTMLAAALFGPLWGMLPGLAGGLINGFLGDVYAFYYLPVQLITGLTAGLLFRRSVPGARPRLFRILGGAALVSLPGTIASASITALLFGGVTSSGSTLFVQLLHRAGLGMTQSVCVVQAVTDYLDRAVVLGAVCALLGALPPSFCRMLQKGGPRDGALQ